MIPGFESWYQMLVDSGCSADWASLGTVFLASFLAYSLIKFGFKAIFGKCG